VSTSFRYISISLGQGRYTPHSASEVLGNGFGDCKDKHTLFAALLRAVGIDARPVLISTSLKLDADVPGPALFDHVITAIPQGNTYVWMDTTPGAAPLRLLTSNLRDKLALIVLGDGKGLLAKTPADPPFPTFQHFTMTATLTDDGKLEGKARLEVRGDDEVALRQAFRNTDPTQWDQLGQTLSGAFGFGGTVDNVAAATPEDTSSAFWISYNYHRPEYGDWPNHRIILPFPFLGLPQLSEDEAKSPAGMPLGMVQEIRYEARVTLPKGFVPTVPPAVTKNNEFARYESAYSVDGSVLQGTRSLHLLQHDIPAKNRQAYVSFYKSIVEDEGQWIALVGGRITGGPHSENPEAQRLLDDGYESVQLGAPASAIKSIEQAIKLDPKLSAAWVLLASAHMMNSQFDAGASDLRKAIELDPANNRAYAILAMAYASRYRYREAIETWREFLKAFPEDRTASGNLAQLLIEEENYSEARTLLEKLVAEAPTARLHLNLGNTYLHLGEDENARTQFQKATELEPGSGTLNDAAYLMAEANRGLDHALPYAEEAVRETEAETSATPAPRYDLMSQLAAQWDTLGWVRFHRGELDAAEHYLSAAWKIWQVPMLGDHLAQVYEKQGESARAMHMYSLALAALGPKGDPRLREKLQARLKSLDSSSANLAKSQDELQKLRTFSLKAYFDAGKSAEFLVALRKGPKIDEVKFLSGEEELRKADSAIAALKFNVEFPDDGPTRIVERGVLSCSKVRHDCMFVIYPVSSSPASIRPTSVAPPAGN
jgi:tetratricopeptide (TPR) repeat protein